MLWILSALLVGHFFVLWYRRAGGSFFTRPSRAPSRDLSKHIRQFAVDIEEAIQEGTLLPVECEQVVDQLPTKHPETHVLADAA